MRERGETGRWGEGGGDHAFVLIVTEARCSPPAAGRRPPGLPVDPSGELFPEAAPCSGATVTLALCPPQPDLTRCCPSDAVRPPLGSWQPTRALHLLTARPLGGPRTVTQPVLLPSLQNQFPSPGRHRSVERAVRPRLLSCDLASGVLPAER